MGMGASGPEIDLLSLPSEEWREMQAAAAVLDLVHGGYYRARPRDILFFCGPDHAPEGWSAPFADGTEDQPRALVGQAEVEAPDGENGVLIRLSVSNWGAMRDVKQAFDRGEYRGRFGEFVLDQEAALRGRPEDRAWLRAAFRRLRSHASGSLLGET